MFQECTEYTAVRQILLQVLARVGMSDSTMVEMQVASWEEVAAIPICDQEATTLSANCQLG